MKWNDTEHPLDNNTQLMVNQPVVNSILLSIAESSSSSGNDSSNENIYTSNNVKMCLCCTIAVFTLFLFTLIKCEKFLNTGRTTLPNPNHLVLTYNYFYTMQIDIFINSCFNKKKL